MRYTIITTHARLADGFASAAGLFGIDTSNTTVISAYVDDVTDEVFKKKVDDFFTEHANDEIVAFTDISFGSVNQYLSLYMHKHPNFHLITGTNVAVMMEIMTRPLDVPISKEEMAAIVSNARSTLMYMNNMVSSVSEDDE